MLRSSSSMRSALSGKLRPPAPHILAGATRAPSPLSSLRGSRLDTRTHLLHPARQMPPPPHSGWPRPASTPTSSSVGVAPTGRLRAPTVLPRYERSVGRPLMASRDPSSLFLTPRKPVSSLDCHHPIFGQHVPPPEESSPGGPNACPLRARNLLSTVHPAFGDDPRLEQLPDDQRFNGPVSISGFFFCVVPTFCLPHRNDRMNASAHLTIRDHHGGAARVRYRCRLRGKGGMKLELLLRCQVGWIGPKVTFAKLPYRVRLGPGYDISIPFIMHFTAVSILDEHDCHTGSYLYFSGTPLVGVSGGFIRIEGGELVHNPQGKVDPEVESAHFFGHLHYRQLGFVGFKLLGYVLCWLAVVYNVKELIRTAKQFCMEMLPEKVQHHLSHAPEAIEEFERAYLKEEGADGSIESAEHVSSPSSTELDDVPIPPEALAAVVVPMPQIAAAALDTPDQVEPTAADSLLSSTNNPDDSGADENKEDDAQPMDEPTKGMD